KLAGTQLSKWRWALGLKGLASVAVGVMILAWPGISVYALTIVFGAFALASGIVELGSSFQAQSKQERITLILSGLLGIAVGVVVFAWPSISALASLYLPVDGKTTSLMILTGIVSILFGIVIFAKPGTGALAVLALIAAFALI